MINFQLFSQVVDLYKKFTIKIDTNNNNTFSIIEITDFNKKISWSKANEFLNTDLNGNQIQGIFTKDTLNNTILVIKSGLSQTIDYKLLIKIPFKRKFHLTTTSLLQKNVVSVEIWPYKIKKIKFANFEFYTNDYENETFDLFQIKDSTCIKNESLTKENAEMIFRQQLDSVMDWFTQRTEFTTDLILNYENNINSDNVSLNHYWSLGKSIYPNMDEYEFNIPISFRRVECPVFDGSVNYFNTKKNNLIKVVSFNWIEFKERVFNQQTNEERIDIHNKFNEKFDFIYEEICSIFGEPFYNSDADGRRQIKWKNEDGINVYMFNFSSINEIRLYIYID